MARLATYIPMQTVTPGSAFSVSIHAHDDSGQNFNWTGYTPKAKLTVGSTTVNVNGTVISAAGGTASFAWTAAQTATLGNNAWGTIMLYADPTANAENVFIADIDVQTNAEVIP